MKTVKVSQVNNHTCVHACLSMVTGVSIDDLIKRFGDTALGFDEIVVTLVEHGIFPRNTTGGPHQFPLCGNYLVSCGSKNLKAKEHQILVEASSEGFIVHDPQAGREGMETWHGDEIMQGLMPITEVLYLDYSCLSKMEAAKVPHANS